MCETDYSVITKEFSRSCVVEVDVICVICLVHNLTINQAQVLKIFKYLYTHIYFLLY